MPIVEWLKVSWMLTWRFVVVSTILFNTASGWLIVAGFLIAGILVFVFQKTIPIFPIIRAIFKKPYVKPSKKVPQSFEPEVQAPLTFQESSTERGRMTGFEPKVLNHVRIPHNLPQMYGTPGAGLHSSGFGSRSIGLGVKGEELFAKALMHTGSLPNLTSFWSVAMPSKMGMMPDMGLNTDIDCIISAGHKIYLIDLKYYISGDVTYYNENNQLFCLDAHTGNQVGQPKKMSRNMEMAQDRFKKLFPGMKIESFVVLVPTDRGAASIAYGTTWPGAIPLVGMPEMVQYINKNALGRAPSNVVQGISKIIK